MTTNIETYLSPKLTTLVLFNTIKKTKVSNISQLIKLISLHLSKNNPDV
jgi:hypothetical protein